MDDSVFRSLSLLAAARKLIGLPFMPGCPFSAGRVLHVEPSPVCNGPIGSCAPYLFQRGDDELLIFTGSGTDIGTEDRITTAHDWVWPAAESQALMHALDRAVKEEMQLQDPQTDIARAPERHRVMLALKEAFLFWQIGSDSTTSMRPRNRRRQIFLG